MSLLVGKNWQAQDFYNEYLRLKTEIPELINSRDHFFRHNKDNEAQEFQFSIDEKVERLKFILNQLKVVHGIAMEDLILLSIGIDI
jgi:hypothetical protein